LAAKISVALKEQILWGKIKRNLYDYLFTVKVSHEKFPQSCLETSSVCGAVTKKSGGSEAKEAQAAKALAPRMLVGITKDKVLLAGKKLV
jgi:hypothetical protein